MRFEDYATRVEQQIVHQTGGRIRMLRVEPIGDRVIIRGSAPSYHVKQLALRGAQKVLGTPAAIRIELDVEVSSSPQTHTS